MIQLVKFELYKIFRQKSIYILFFLLLGFVSLSLHGDRDFEKEVYQIYQPWEGKITEEKLNQLDLIHKELDEKMDSDQGWTTEDSILYGIAEGVHYLSDERRIENIAELQKSLSVTKSNFENRNIQLHIDLLSKVDTSKFYYKKGPANLIDIIYTFGFVITAFMLMIGIAPIYSGEYSSGMDQFLLSSKHGRSKAVTAKIFSTIIYALSVVAAWFTASAIYISYVYGWHGWKAPLQSIHAHFPAPYPFTLSEAYAMMLSMHMLAAIGFALMIVFISSICQRVLITLVISGFIFGIPFIIDVVPSFEWLAEISWLNQLLQLSIYHLLKVKEQFSGFITYNIFGHPVSYPVVGVVISLATIAIFWSLTKLTLKRKQVTI